MTVSEMIGGSPEKDVRGSVDGGRIWLMIQLIDLPLIAGCR